MSKDYHSIYVLDDEQQSDADKSVADLEGRRPSSKVLQSSVSSISEISEFINDTQTCPNRALNKNIEQNENRMLRN